MSKNDQIPSVYYNIDDDVNKPFYYKLHVSETDTFGFVGSIIKTLLPNQGYEFAYWTADAAVYQVGSDTAIPAGTPLSSDQLQNKVTVKSDVTFTAHFKQSSENPEDSEITTVKIIGATLSYKPGETPPIRANTGFPTNAGRNLKTTNPLPYGIPTTGYTAPCRPSRNLKARKNMYIPFC